MQEAIITVIRILSNQHIDLHNTKKLFMSQINTNTGGDNTNHNQSATRGGWGKGGSGGRGPGGCTSYHRNSSIANYSFEGKMKDDCLSKLTITESANRTIQYKTITDALPVYCVDKGYQYIDNIGCTNTELLQATILPPYPDVARWSNTYNVQIKTVDLLAISD